LIQRFSNSGVRLVKNPAYDCLMNSQPGCSGGPVFSKESQQIIGVISACLPGDEGHPGNMTATDIRLALRMKFSSPFQDNFNDNIDCYRLRELGQLRG
jgi:V8-like Glu-specific endopeptidase